MTKKGIWAVAAILVVATAAGPAQASGTYFRPSGASQITGPDALGKGRYLVGLQVDMTDFNKVRMVNGLGRPWGTGGVHHKSYSLYGEYGLTDVTSMYFRMPFVNNTAGVPAAAGAAFDDDTGLGDSQIGLNRLLMENRDRGTSLTGTLELTVPLRSYDTTKLTAPGDNSTDLLLKFLWRNRTTPSSKLFYSVGAGYKARLATAADQWVYDAEVGGALSPQFSVSTYIASLNDTGGLGLGGPGFTGDFARLKKTLTAWGFRTNFALGRDSNVLGELYWAHAIQYQNQAPIDYYGLKLTGRY